jgi:DNA-directed RNA polymerase specialized sigma subunit
MDETTKTLLEYRAASGDAKENLLARLMAQCSVSVLPYVLRLAHTWHVQQKDMDDIKSNFWNDAFTPALDDYDATKSASFTTYLTRCAHNKLVDYLRAQRPNTISLESLTDGSENANDRLPEIADGSISSLEQNISEEALRRLQFRCGSEASSTQEQSDFADLMLKLEAAAEEDKDNGIVLTPLHRSLYLRLMARVDKCDHPPSIAPHEPTETAIELTPPRLAALTIALQRANRWKRWESKAPAKLLLEPGIE